MNKGKMANKPQHKCAQNFSEAKKMMLILVQYKDILENKKFDSVTLKNKDKYWNTIFDKL